MDECRYDHVVKAIRALQAYAVTCARDFNTPMHLDRATAEIDKLREIEKKFKHSDHAPAALKGLASALEEVELIVAEYQPCVDKAVAFMNTHAQGIAAFKILSRDIARVERIIEAGNRLRDGVKLMSPHKAALEL